MEKDRRKRIQFIPYFLKTYPEKLKYITDPPYALYVLGQLPDEKEKVRRLLGRETVRRMVNRWHYNMEKPCRSRNTDNKWYGKRN